MSYPRSWLELSAEERRGTIDWLRGWDHKPKLLADFLQSLEERLGRGERLGFGNRESGGSLPDPRAGDDAFLRRPESAFLPGPPVLNKSGGSDVCPTCIHRSHPGEFCGGRFCACAGGR